MISRDFFILFVGLLSLVNGFHFSNRMHHFMNTFAMRDSSTASIYVNVGDKVRISKDVWHNPVGKAKFNSKGLEGYVSSVWDKCEEDPHCCCAELAFDAPFEVEFQRDANHNTSWKAYFSIDELMVMKKIQNKE